MADKPNNKDKNIEIDESVLDETPPNINEPQTPTEEPETPEVEPKEEVIENEPTDTSVDATPDEEVKESEPVPEETQEQKDQRYRAQQSEVQVQTAKNRALIDKVDQANNLPDPTEAELRAFVASDGVDWDELTAFEQATARRTFKAEKRFDLIQEATEQTKKIDEWAGKVDTFIDSTDGKPAYVELSGHESDFRKYCMQEAHRGTPIEVLLGAFLHSLPASTKKRGSLFETGGGGEKAEGSGKITDADEVANLRTTNPREYKRLLKQGKISLEA